MRTIRDLSVLRTRARDWREAGESVAVVPTMGALHEGHLSLVAAAKAACDRVIVTLFVNPKQFNNPQDLAKYPRTEATDAAMLQPLGVDVLFAPDASVVYPDGFLTKVTVARLQDVLCGAHRPGHFDGVATVVTKLLLMTAADTAFFGEKDWQQLQIIRRLVEDLNIPVDVVGCPTLREKDGLAMSSRNQRLSTADRARAPALHAAMMKAAESARAGGDVTASLSAARDAILEAGFAEVDYLELRHGATLEPLDRAAPEARLFAAAWIGGVRLIDNIPLA
ncbi:pantoate--beta-alanine ligase [Frigidibacter sp. SD6-1]|uniref:pantoate--beta-alanine ligase n=1 Tax=Frigidibacter sp. SD6-1 TaxID=3032581 RepID=UPI0024E014B1|nr:pantoate--beta-alanine ligase [Frigidibacter sp. SD6-1]